MSAGRTPASPRRAVAGARPVTTTRHRIVRWSIAALVAVLAVYPILGAWALLGVRTNRGWSAPSASGSAGAINLLLIGTDAAGSDPGRADTLVVVNLPADGSAIYLISVPRGLQVRVPQGDMELKRTREVGGVPLTVQAVRQATGLTIDHTVETDFAGFAGPADLVDGVTVDAPQQRGAGQREAGEVPVTMHGQAALAFVRDHSVPDAVRNQRQRSVLRQVLAKLPVALVNPANLVRLSTDFLSHVGTDDALPADLPTITARLVQGRDRVVEVAAPLLPQQYAWGLPQLDTVRMATLAAAMRDGTMAGYRP